LRLTVGFGDQAIRWCQSNCKRSNPGCHGNEIWDEIGYNSACIYRPTKYLGHLCVQHGVFGVGLLNDVTQILPRPTLVAMATKLKTQLTITRLRQRNL